MTNHAHTWMTRTMAALLGMVLICHASADTITL